MTAPTRHPNLPSLTGARWWAAMAVFILHAVVFIQAYPFQHTETFRTIHKFVPMQLGSAGVTFFFILSGFLIYWSNSEVRPGHKLGSYYLRRMTKIFPTHWAALILFMLASATISFSGPERGFHPAMDFQRLELWVPNAFLVHTWLPGWAVLSGMNVPSWSLVAEMLFYLSFPLFVPLVNRVRGRGDWAALLTLFATSFAIVTAIHLFAPGAKGTENFFVPRLWDMPTSPIAEVHAHPLWFQQKSIPVDVTYWMSYYFPPTRLIEFYLGVFIAKLVWSRRFSNTRILWPLVLLIVSFAATWWVPVAFKMSVVMSLPMAIVIGTLAARDLEGRSGWIGSAPMVWLGNISFAFYMVQFPVMVAIQRYVLFGRELGLSGWATAAVLAFGVSVVLAWAIFELIDEPLMRLARRAGHRRN